jgi:hypothetical protein
MSLSLQLMTPSEGTGMWYAIFAGDDYYHLVKSQSVYTLCGLPTLKRDRGGEEYHPPARVLRESPPVGLYRSCPRCVAEDNSAKLKDVDSGATGVAGE